MTPREIKAYNAGIAKALQIIASIPIDLLDKKQIGILDNVSLMIEKEEIKGK